MKMTRKVRMWAMLAVAILFVLGGLLSWKIFHKDPPHYLTSPVERTDLENAVLATGRLQGIRQVDVGVQVSGQLKSLKVEIGDQVKKGQWLAKIDPVILKNDLLVAQTEQESLQAKQVAAKARLDEAKTLFTRQQSLLEHKATSQQDYDKARMHLRVLQAEVNALNAQIRQARARVDSAAANLSYTRILAPMDGEVVNITTLEGQTVIATQEAPTILKLADLSTITVKAQVSEADVIRIRPGLPVYFTILGEPDKKYHGTLRTIQPSPEKINEAMFFHALFDVPNPQHKLRLDMTVQVSIVLGEVRNVLTIPAMALGEAMPDGRYEVRVLNKDDSVSTRLVKIGMNNNVRAQVLAGLTEKDKVITGEEGNDDTGGPAS